MVDQSFSGKIDVVGWVLRLECAMLFLRQGLRHEGLFDESNFIHRYYDNNTFMWSKISVTVLHISSSYLPLYNS